VLFCHNNSSGSTTSTTALVGLRRSSPWGDCLPVTIVDLQLDPGTPGVQMFATTALLLQSANLLGSAE
jgi:hypothetical protein